MEKNNTINNLLKIMLVGAVVLIAVTLFIYVQKPTKVKTTFELCFEKCKELGRPPVNGKCQSDSYLGVRTTNKGEWKKGDPWCYVGEGKCLTVCK